MDPFNNQVAEHARAAGLDPYNVRDDPGLCAWCGDYATKVVELTISHKAPPGTRKARGKYIGSVTKRACDIHAADVFAETKWPKHRPKGRH